MPNDISPLVPTELLVAVLTEQLDEDEAIARGLLAAVARNPEERRAILFAQLTSSTEQRPPVPRVGPMPWFEP